MNLYRFLILFCLVSFCNAGPVIAIIVRVATAIGKPAAGTAIAGSSLAKVFGVGASGIWYGNYVIVNGALYYGSGAAAVGALAGGAAAGVAVGVEGAVDKGEYDPITDKQESESIMASISAASNSQESVRSKEEASKASVHSKEEASKASVRSKEDASKASISSKESASKASISSKESASKASASLIAVASSALDIAKASVLSIDQASKVSAASVGAANLAASSALSASAASRDSVSLASASATGFIGPANTNSAIPGPQTKGPVAASPTIAPPPPPGPAAANGAIPPPPGQPVSTVAPENRPKEVPPGVPDYNFRMCQYDIIRMGEKNQNLTFDNPEGYSLRVNNIPPTCMVLATVMLGDPQLGPHPIPMGSASLQWNNVNPEIINEIRKVFGLPPR